MLVCASNHLIRLRNNFIGNSSRTLPADQIPFLEVASSAATGHGLRTRRHFPAGAEVIDLRKHAEAVPEPSRYSIQVGRDSHIDGPYTRHLNHSCEPNVFVDTAAWKVLSLRELEIGEELNFFYPSTEWEMVSPFVCGCNSAGCHGVIAGASDIPSETLRGYRLNEHIEQLITERDGSLFSRG
jgi:hypothetical protein